MIVYRFERHGIGPYINGFGMRIGSWVRMDPRTRSEKIYSKIFDKYISRFSDAERNHLWWKAHQSKKYLYGCSSKEQLKAYFGGNFKVLFKAGFRIKRYKVPDKEVIDMGVEVAFPVKYHKLRTVNNIKKRTPFY